MQLHLRQIVEFSVVVGEQLKRQKWSSIVCWRMMRRRGGQGGGAMLGTAVNQILQSENNEKKKFIY